MSSWFTLSHAWLVVGFAGQLAFGSRFLWQWIASERARAVVVPPSFWVLSIVGGIALLVYAVHRKDPVFVLGQGMGLLIYVRNLFLHRASVAK
jgi:lipid-A-disaccharide synthase-like uncharacterized protein